MAVAPISLSEMYRYVVGYPMRKCKLRWHGHVTRITGLSKTILQGLILGRREIGRQRIFMKTISRMGHAQTSTVGLLRGFVKVKKIRKFDLTLDVGEWVQVSKKVSLIRGVDECVHWLSFIQILFRIF